MAGMMFLAILLAIIALALEGEWFAEHASEFMEEEERRDE